MDSQIAHSHPEGEDEHHHEKQSVLTKVKVKAKKIRDTLTKHGGHGHDEHDIDEDDGEEETIEAGKVGNLEQSREEEGRAREERHETKGSEPPIKGHNKGQPTNNNRVVTFENPIITGKEPTHWPQEPNKVADPTDTAAGGNGKEAGITPLLESFDKMKVHDPNPAAGTDHNNNSPTTGIYDHFSPELVPQDTDTNSISDDNKHQLPQSFDTTKPEDHSDDIFEKNPSNQSNTYTGKISSAAISAKNAVASKFGYGDKDDTVTNLQAPGSGGRQFSPPKSVSHKAKSMGDKSQLQQSFDTTKPEDYSDDIPENPSNQSTTYTGKVSSAAISAKNAVASKLGYGEKDDTKMNEAPGSGGSQSSPKSVSHKSKFIGGVDTTKPEHHSDVIPESPSNKTSTYTEKISSAITDQAISAKNAVATKLGYSVNEAPGSVVTEKPRSPVSKKILMSESGDKGQKKGGSKVYIAEKTKPREEDRDRALSEMISDSLQKRNEDPEPEQAHNKRHVGKVAESEVEVSRRLGSGGDENKVGSPGKGVVDKVKGAVGSWFGLGEESESQVHFGSSQGDDGKAMSNSPSPSGAHISNVTEGRRLKESSNN